jgi:hypothetical protein
VPSELAGESFAEARYLRHCLLLLLRFLALFAGS